MWNKIPFLFFKRLGRYWFDIVLNKDTSAEINNIIGAYFLESEDKSLSYIPNTNLINIIIGSNNSGKSRFMRYLMQCKNLIGVKNLKQVEKSINDYNRLIESFNETQIIQPKKKYESLGYSYYGPGNDPKKERFDFLMANKLYSLHLGFRESKISLPKLTD